MSEIGCTVKVLNPMQENYEYELTEDEGKNFGDGFNPYFTPKEMLSMGVFEGKYLNSCEDEYPSHWFESAILSDMPDPSLNHFALKSLDYFFLQDSKYLCLTCYVNFLLF